MSICVCFSVLTPSYRDVSKMRQLEGFSPGAVNKCVHCMQQILEHIKLLQKPCCNLSLLKMSFLCSSPAPVTLQKLTINQWELESFCTMLVVQNNTMSFCAGVIGSMVFSEVCKIQKNILGIPCKRNFVFSEILYGSRRSATLRYSK